MNVVECNRNDPLGRAGENPSGVACNGLAHKKIEKIKRNKDSNRYYIKREHSISESDEGKKEFEIPTPKKLLQTFSEETPVKKRYLYIRRTHSQCNPDLKLKSAESRNAWSEGSHDSGGEVVPIKSVEKPFKVTCGEEIGQLDRNTGEYVLNAGGMDKSDANKLFSNRSSLDIPVVSGVHNIGQGTSTRTKQQVT